MDWKALLAKGLKPPCKPDPALDVLSPENNAATQRLKGVPVVMAPPKETDRDGAARGGEEPRQPQPSKKVTKNYAKMAREQ